MTVQPFNTTADHIKASGQLSELFQGTNIVDAGERNKKLVLQFIRANGLASCKQISRFLALTIPAVHKIIKDLNSAQYILPASSVQNERGKPERFWAINASSHYALGLSFQNDKALLICLDFTGSAVKKIYLNSEPHGQFLTQLRSCINDLLEMVASRRSRIVGLGVALQEFPFSSSGVNGSVALKSHNIIDQITGMAEEFGLLLCFENCLAAATIGEMLYGRGLKADTFLYVQIGNAVDGSLVVNRQYCRGQYGSSNSISSLPNINPFELQMSDVAKTIGQTVLPNDLFNALELKNSSEATSENFQSPGVFASSIDHWIATFADYMFYPILNILSLMNLEAVYIGGAIPRSIRQQICTEITSRLSASPMVRGKSINFSPSSWEDDACAVGVAVAVLEGHGLPIYGART